MVTEGLAQRGNYRLPVYRCVSVARHGTWTIVECQPQRALPRRVQAQYSRQILPKC